MMTVWAEQWVNCSHVFKHYPLHGHDYLVRVSVLVPDDQRSGDPRYPAVDADILKAALGHVCSEIDHRVLNDVLPQSGGSMEGMGRWFAAQMGRQFQVVEVAISRPMGLGCVYRPGASSHD